MRSLGLAFLVLLAACTGGGVQTTTSVVTTRPGPGAPEETFDSLRRALAGGDDQWAAALTDPGQFALVASADGADAAVVMALDIAERLAVGANFWGGFRERFALVAGVDVGSLSVGDATTRTVDGVGFSSGEFLNRLDGSGRTIVLRQLDDGAWVVDLVATFPSPLLLAVPEAVEGARRDGEPAFVEELRGLEHSIRWLLSSDDLDPQIQQAGLAALQAIGA